MIVGAADEAAHPVGVAGAPAQNDHGQIGIDARGEPIGRAHSIQQHESVPVLEAEVQHDQRRLAHLDRPQALRHAAGANRRKTIRGQILQ